MPGTDLTHEPTPAGTMTQSAMTRPAMTRPAILLSLLLALLLPLAASAATPTPLVEGRDYVVIDGGQPWQPLDGKIEVVEIFAYWCPHCAEFQPQLEAWSRKLPADVRLSYVAAVFDPGDNFARAFFAARQLGAAARTHDDVFRAVHVDGLLPRNASIDELAFYYGQHGLSRAGMKAAMVGPAVEAKLRAARDFGLRSGIEGTPTLIINGRYRLTPRTHEDAFRIADQLIAKLRKAS